MGRLTVRLPDTLHRLVETQARQESVSLNSYIIYALARHVAQAYQVREMPAAEVQAQRQQFQTLLGQLGQATTEQVLRVLAAREEITSEPELTPEVVARFRERLSQRPH